MDKNSKEYESLQAKLKKLLALAEQGVGGEAVNARRLLEKLCKQYGISVEELLERETKHSYTFEIGRVKEMKQLFIRCLEKVVDIEGMTYSQPTRSSMRIEVTALQRAEILSLFNWHKSNYMQELEDFKRNFFSAYVGKHNLYIEIDSNVSKGIEELTEEDIARIRRVLAMREAMSDNHYYKQLDVKKQ